MELSTRPSVTSCPVLLKSYTQQSYIDPRDQGVGRVMTQFRQECALLENIRHPNIVQYLGMTLDPESRLPVLLIELLDESLTKMLERSPQSLAYYTQVDISHDIALAIAYLHSNNIIHRDCSSNNVLIIAGRRAKVTDFGMSKLAGAAPIMTPLTMCPGTLAYMPPEALRDPPRYTKKLDCFSEGVIMIQVCTRLWPEPGPRTQIIQDSRSPTGIIEMPVPETERRKKHIDLIAPNNALLPIAIDCIKYQERERPSSEELCQRLAGLKESTKYRQSVKKQRNEFRAKDDQLSAVTQQLREMTVEKEKIIQAKDRALQEKERQLREDITLRERQLRQLNQQLEQQLSQQVRITSDHKQHPPKILKVTLNWSGEGKLPYQMLRGEALVDGGVAYFVNCNGEACSYNSTSKKWSELPEYPYQHGSLAIVNHQLTGIGGCESVFEKQTYTNKLLSLRGSWSDVFLPMPTKRICTTAVTSKEHLIVAGGATGPDCTDNVNTVEVMDTKTLAWSTVASLPRPYSWATATICVDHLYMLGGYDDKGKTKSVLTCSLTELLQSSSSSVWHRVADVPAYLSTCAAVNGQLLAVGGCDEDCKATAAVHKYNPTTNSWDRISKMPTARYRYLVAVLPTNEMMVVGGQISPSKITDKVVIAMCS